MLGKFLNIAQNVIYRKARHPELITTIQAPKQQHKTTKKLSARSHAELSFRIQMCVASEQAHAFEYRSNDLAPIPPLMRSIIRDLNRLREFAPEEELKFRYMLSQVNAPVTPAASNQFASLAQKAKSHDSLYNETIAVE
ncbi:MULTISPECIES: hypothetical protein [Deefgea]|uniref:Uncharacterized protein n=1 Tax=Deefgea chitinilytica TaxID=570276 RepID=A0ABS2C9L6_9NEIS|nr:MULTISPECIES: hypothetical protein [Deefgea]MBM5570066.1 hypothetical protein [Deefgea chitinilytica]MBM9887295.1 hypothetical protein [Deefgea sp. CFH1-16]